MRRFCGTVGRRPALAVLLLLVTSATLAAEEPGTPWEHLAAKYDRNQDGRISRKEYGRDQLHWDRLDGNGDGFLEQAEIESRKRRGGRTPRRSGVAPRRGRKAPDFKLRQIDGPGMQEKSGGKKPSIRLSSYAGRRPVALIFGSYT